MLVEDSPESGLMEKRILEMAGFTCHLCKNGEEAWGWLEDNIPSLIISDWMMPKIDGVELCQRIRQDRRLAHITYLMLTARSGTTNITTALDAGVDEFITKPINRQELIARVRAGLRQRRLNDQLSHAEKLKAITTLTAGIAHDYNNKLGSLLTNLCLLQNSGVNMDQQGILQDMETAIKHMSELNHKLIAFSGQGKYLARPINLNKLIEKVIQLHHPHRSTWIDRYLDSSIDRVEADPAQLEQVVFHLLQNAVESLQDNGINKGKIEIITSKLPCLDHSEGSPDETTDSWASLKVRDFGCGMTPETLNRIYDPFYTTKFHGRGLGMAAVHGIVTNHKGKIQIQSQPNKGTTVQIILPFHS